MQSTIELSTMQEMAIERLAWSRNFAMSLIDSLSEDQRIVRVGGKGNHAIWVMGHLAFADDYTVSCFTGKARQLDDAFNELFQYGSTPSDDPAVYPDHAALLDTMQQARDGLVRFIESLDDRTSFADAPESLRPVTPDAITLGPALAAHELFHCGQIAAVRAALGLSPVHG